MTARLQWIESTTDKGQVAAYQLTDHGRRCANLQQPKEQP